MRRLFLATTAIVALSLAPDAARADPVSAIITALGGTATLGVVGTALVRIGVGVAFSALSNAIAGGRNKPTDPGIRTQSRTAGEETPQSFILGRYATAGNLVAPYASFSGESTSTPNYNITHIYDLGDLPVSALRRVFVNGEAIELVASGDRLDTSTQPYAGDLHLHFYDGTQTETSDWLIDVIGDHPRRPWQADMVGIGIPYVAAQLEYHPDTWQGGTNFLWEVDGIALYDPRADSTAGGSGPQRFADPSTWSFSRNPVVMIYTLLRGITLPDGTVYGGGYGAADLPFAVWAAAMDAAEPTFDGEGKVTAGYAAGYEVVIGSPDAGGEEPADVIEELLKACSAEIADVGGTVYIRVGAPELPVRFLWDDDILRNLPQELDPFPGLAEAINGVHGAHPSPEDAWQTRDAPPRYDLEAEAEDGRRLIGEVKLPAVTDGDQAQRLMAAWLKDARRMRRHTITLPPEGMLLRPLQTIAWTSARNGYEDKLFEIAEKATDPMTLSVTLALREVDPEDYDPDAFDLLPVTTPPQGAVYVAAEVLPGFYVYPAILTDDQGRNRRPALRPVWSDALPDVTAISWEVRVKATAVVTITGSSTDVARGEAFISDGVLGGVTYEVRATYRAPGRPTLPTDWVEVTAPEVFLSAADLDAALTDEIDGAVEAVADLREEAIAAFGPLDVATSLTARVIASYGPLDPESSLDARIGSLDAVLTSSVSDIERIDRELLLARPREIDLTDAVRSIGETLTRVALQLRDVRKDVSDAGLYIDPASGTARLEGIARVDGKIGEVSVALDAARAAIELRATHSDLSVAISEALLDPTQIPIVDDIRAQLSEVAITLSALEGAIEAKADTVTVDGLDLTLTEAVTRIDSLEGVAETFVTQTQLGAVETRVTDAELLLGTYDGASFQVALSDIRSQGEAIQRGEYASLSALLEGYQERKAVRTDIAYATQNMRALVDEDRVAIAQTRLELGAAIDDATALVEAERTARATETAALAEDITSLLASAGGLQGQIDQINTVSADSGSGTARAVHQLQLEVTTVGEDLAGQAEALQLVEGRVEEAEDGLEVTVRDARIQSARLRGLDAEADRSNLRSILLDREARKAAALGAAEVRQETLTRVLENESAAAALREELSAGIAGAVALVTTETEARVTADAATATQLAVLAVEIDDTATGLSAEVGARQALDGRVEVTEDGLVAIGMDVTALEASIGAAEDDIAATASAVDGLQTQVAQTEAGLDAQASLVTSLDTRLDAVEGGVSGNASALSSLDARVQQNEGTIVGYGQSITELSAELGTASDALDIQAVALDSLTTRVEESENGIVALAQDGTALESRVETAETGLSSVTNAVDLLDTRADAIEGVNSAQGTAITGLQSSLTVLDGEVGGKADASAVSALTTRVTGTEDATEALSSSLLRLRSDLDAGALSYSFTFAGDLGGLSLEDAATVDFSVTASAAPADKRVMQVTMPVGLQVGLRLSIPATDLRGRTLRWTGLAYRQGGAVSLAAAALRQVSATDATFHSLIAGAAVAASGAGYMPFAVDVVIPDEPRPVYALRLRLTGAEGATLALADLKLRDVTVAADVAQVEQLATSKVDAAGAIAAVEQSISAEYDGLEALAESTAFARAGVEGIQTGYLWRVRAGGAVGEMELVAADTPLGPATAFRVTSERMIFDGDCVITGTLTRSLFANGELQIALNPIDVEVITRGNDGSFQFKHAGLVEMYVVGGGGGGGAAFNDATDRAAGAGGGAGAVCRHFFASVDPGLPYTASVGGGGTGGLAPGRNDQQAGSDGATTFFTGQGLSFAAGGGKGGGSALGSSGSLTATGGLGGTASGAQDNFAGGRGADAVTGSALGSGGGSISLGLIGATPNGSGGAGGQPAQPGILGMRASPLPFIGYAGSDFSGGAGASLPTAGLGGAATGASPVVGCGGGGAAKRGNDSLDEAVGGAGGEGAIFIFYYGIRSFT